MLFAATIVMLMPVSACAAPARSTECSDTRLHSLDHDCLRFGISTPGGPAALAEFERVAEAARQTPTLILSFSDFTAPPPIEGLNAIMSFGAEPVVTWEPWRWLGEDEYDEAAFSMQSIADGLHDDYLYSWADQLAAWGRTVYLRFAHEANGTWYPWSVARGTSAETYLEAWRHVHDLFASKGADNVKWIWAPNVSFHGSSPIAELYPGDSYVDVVGVDGYNWGTTHSWSHWIDPASLFGPTLDELRALAPGKPIVITEVGSADMGGSKPDWIRELVTLLDEDTSVAAFIWFDYDKEADWRFSSTPESAAAFASALKERLR
ncbi:putative mannan endo-1,4-beta-mannosidase [Hoyosella subflava DQS3-9A1]|uniref:Putative mannan endo-1,4-beta-mannosidase n=1 Tax=Hoyosella subflava (strain DSM 45089 / JCM 17490 / NBRC 109087 / DQS3-9A1) TaxID=443218 RepID=F6EET8_HOYSD|nr:putative mannan endo-1,4-beta-mannosidase [Hoyosella subflava DQS3-9A1]